MSDDATAPDVEPTEGVEIDTPAGSSTETDAPDDAVEAKSPRRTIPVIPLALVVSLLAAAGLAGYLYFADYRPDTQVDGAVEQTVVNAARTGTMALLTYKAESLDHDLEAAKSHVSGDFAKYYDQFTAQVIRPAAQSKGVTTTAQVVGAAATELHPNSAVVLVFVNQLTTSKERPDPALASSSVLVTLNKQHGDWLITKFDPI